MLVLCLAAGVIFSALIVTNESQANAPVYSFATPFAKQVPAKNGQINLEQRLMQDMQKLTPRHQDYNHDYVKPLLAQHNDIAVNMIGKE